MELRKITVGLCAGRHEIPDVENYIFGENDIPDPTDIMHMQLVAYKKLGDLLPYAPEIICEQPNDAAFMGDVELYDRGCELVIYVTGLTAALVETFNAARMYYVRHVTLMHYNRDTGNYFPQEVTI